MNALLLPSPFPLPPCSPFPCDRAPSLLPVAPPRSHPSISAPTSLKEGRGGRFDLSASLAVVKWRASLLLAVVGVVIVRDVAYAPVLGGEVAGGGCQRL
jgi:hypothetical protein